MTLLFHCFFSVILLLFEVKVWTVVPVVVGFKRAILVQAQVFCLLIGKLCQVGLKGGQMQTGNILICNAPVWLSQT